MTEKELVPLDFEMVRDEYEDRWSRGDPDEADITVQEPGVFRVALADGDDTHDVLFAEQGDREVGWCDCDGFNFHTKQGKGPCAHLCTLGKLTIFDEIPVPPVDDLGTPEDVDGRDQDDVVDEDPEQVLEEENDDVQEDPGDDRRDDDDDDGRDVDEPPVDAGAEEIVVPDPDREQPALAIDGAALDDPLETLPEWMKTKVDQRDGSVDINKRGCQVIANYLGLDVDPEPIKRAHETDFKYAVYEATVRLDDEQVAHAEAEAHVDENNVDKWDLNRMAETRAKKRAVKWATGGGIQAFAKSEGEDQETTEEKLNGDRPVDEEVSV
jgi:hypothetical protein